MGYSLNSLDSLFLTEKKKKKEPWEWRMQKGEGGCVLYYIDDSLSLYDDGERHVERATQPENPEAST